MKKIILLVCIFSFSNGIAQITFSEVVSDFKINTPAVASLGTYAFSPRCRTIVSCDKWSNRIGFREDTDDNVVK
tara:strand:+ start:430 stop:651 length:222 start_codon:yes stop_codon:yes gene_type:complete